LATIESQLSRPSNTIGWYSRKASPRKESGIGRFVMTAGNVSADEQTPSTKHK
jgi:hypothetical protein